MRVIFSLYFVCVCVLFCVVSVRGVDNVNDYDVIVIGGGISGLRAAQVARADGRSVLVLEARTRMGGRIYTDRQTFSYPVDMGASWIHGVTNNPIAQLAQSRSIATLVTDYDNVQVTNGTDGQVWTAAQVTSLTSLYSQVMRDVRTTREQLDKDTSLQAVVNMVLAKDNYATLTNTQRELIQTQLAYSIEQEYAADTDSLSAWEYDNNQRIQGDDVIFPGGYDQIPMAIYNDILQQGVQVKFGSLVTAVDTSSCSNVRVTVNTSTVLTGRAVIVTVPLGVLKRGLIQFTPSLPTALQASIQRIGMGVLGKYVIEFGNASVAAGAGAGAGWPSSSRVFYQRVGGSSPRSENSLGQMLNLRWAFNAAGSNNPPNTLIVFAAGNAAASFSAMNDQQIINQIVTNIQTTLNANIGAPTRFLASRWDMDPYTYGAYSYAAVGSSIQDRRQFASSGSVCLAFAGEHTSVDNPSTVHGAYVSGQSAYAKIRNATDNSNSAPTTTTHIIHSLAMSVITIITQWVINKL